MREAYVGSKRKMVAMMTKIIENQKSGRKVPVMRAGVHLETDG